MEPLRGCDRLKPGALRVRKKHRRSTDYFFRDEPFFPRLAVLRFFVAPEVLFFLAPPFLPPPDSLFTVAQARRSASPVLTPFFL
jgi:hypothetical protein